MPILTDINTHTQKHKPEVLAPVGSYEAAEAAVRAGADAVYLGYGRFNARKNAGFDRETLVRITSLCADNGVNVHCALNTLVFEHELNTALNDAYDAAELGVNAFIVQDIGLASALSKYIPEMPLHASTQMSIHNITGARFAAEQGFSRIVLARELSGREIAEIRAALPELELECFVHGALCMSVSGQCLFSALLGTRSGNRGLCAQTCRLPFSNGVRECCLSLKDMSLIKHIGFFADNGITSLKIEGRLKRPEYVAAATYAVRKAVDGESSAIDEELLRDVFSRSGFTDGYFTGDRGARMFGIRRKEDTEKSAEAYAKINEITRTSVPRFDVDMKFTVTRAGCALIVTDAASGKYAQVAGGSVQDARTPSGEERIEAALRKTGGTNVRVRNAHVLCPPELFVPTGEINSLRRDGIRELMHMQTHRISTLHREEIKTDRGSLANDFTLDICAEHIETLPELLPDGGAVILPTDELLAHRERVAKLATKREVIAALPRLICTSAAENAYRNMLRAAKLLGVSTVLCNNLSHFLLAKDAGMNIYGGYGLNVTNGLAAATLRKLGARRITLSPELTLARMSAFTEKGDAAIVYGRLPCMLTRSCPMQGDRGCAGCTSAGGTGSITDRLGEEFPVICHRGYAEIVNSRPLYMADRLSEVVRTGVSHGIMMFTTESRDEAAQVIAAYLSGKPAFGAFTRGLYYRNEE